MAGKSHIVRVCVIVEIKKIYHPIMGYMFAYILDNGVKKYLKEERPTFSTGELIGLEYMVFFDKNRGKERRYAKLNKIPDGDDQGYYESSDYINIIR